MPSSVNQSFSDKQVKLLINTYLLATMVFQKAISCLQYLTSRKTKKQKNKTKIKIKKDDKATETKTTKGEYEVIQSNVIVVKPK